MLGSLASLIRPRLAARPWAPWAAGAVEFLIGGAAVGLIANATPWSQTLAATAVVAGRQWPVWGGNRGDVGLWVAAGALSAVTPLAVPVGAVLWALTFVASGYRSAGTVVATALLPLGLGFVAGWAFALMALPVTLLCVERVRDDARRWLSGAEPKHHWR